MEPEGGWRQRVEPEGGWILWEGGARGWVESEGGWSLWAGGAWGWSLREGGSYLWCIQSNMAVLLASPPLSQGGYNLSSISSSMCACVAALLGDPLPVLELSPPNDR